MHVLKGIGRFVRETTDQGKARRDLIVGRKLRSK